MESRELSAVAHMFFGCAVQDGGASRVWLLSVANAAKNSIFNF